MDSEGKVSLSQLTALLESSIYEKSDSKYPKKPEMSLLHMKVLTLIKAKSNVSP